MQLDPVSVNMIIAQISKNAHKTWRERVAEKDIMETSDNNK